MNNGYGKHDLWVFKDDTESWQQAILRYPLYPEDKEALTAWAIEEDRKRLQSASNIGNEFFIPADLTPAEAADDALQHQARIDKETQARQKAEREVELDLLRAQAEYRDKYLRPGVPQHVRELAAVDLMTPEELEEKLRPEALANLSPDVAAATCERYLKLEGITESARWENSTEE